MNRRMLAFVALLAVLPTTVQAQSAEDRIENAKARALSAGIPVSLLESKVEEGRAKGVPMDRIAAAVEQRATALSQAQAAMARAGRDLSEADLASGADALGSGISEVVLQTLTARAPRERRAVAITVLTELVTLGQVPEEALQRVTEALQRGPEALASLPGQAADAREVRGASDGAPGRAGAGTGRAGAGGPPAGAGAAGSAPAGPPAAVPTSSGRPGAGGPGAGRP
jgi:hypothetical protein